MNEGPTCSPLLSREDVQRIMGAAESTVDGWLEAGEIACFKKGRFTRVQPEALLDFILRYTRGRKRQPQMCLAVVAGPEAQVMWERIERLVHAVVEKELQSQAGVEERRAA